MGQVLKVVNSPTPDNKKAVVAKNQLSKHFFRRGVTIGLFSGLTYGLYSAFLTVGMSKGVWGDWYGLNTAGLSVFAITYMLGVLGCAVNDTFSAIFALSHAAIKGKLGDFFRCLNTAPGRMMILAALIGGPIASAAYVVSLQLAGSIIIPITALCPAIGAILSRILFKQKLNKRMMVGIAICVFASVMIGSTSMGGDAPEGMVLGMIIAFVAALGWGFEGCVAGYGTALIDSEIGISIRQTTSGLASLIIVVPPLGILSGDSGIAMKLTIEAFTSGPAIVWFVVSGAISFVSYMSWYKGNSMCGTALGMACNGTYSFFGPFCCWIILGVFLGIEGWALPAIAWVAAVVMMIGILVISMNPLDLFRKEEELYNETA
jgi:drug/metabolite transporter (DMT)-like permease